MISKCYGMNVPLEMFRCSNVGFKNAQLCGGNVTELSYRGSFVLNFCVYNNNRSNPFIFTNCSSGHLCWVFLLCDFTVLKRRQIRIMYIIKITVSSILAEEEHEKI